jgi:DNA repair protein RecO (recombination protein O)
MTHKVKGIILKKRDLRESDRFFSIYTDELGKIEAVAKGARKIKSKMAGHLDLFSTLNLMVASGKTYYQIAGVETLENFINLKSDLIKIALASYCLEMIDIFTKTDHPDLKIYAILNEILEIFNDKKNKDYLKLYGLSKFFILKLISFLGWTPELYNCVKCKKKIVPNGNLFDAARGGLVCGACRREGTPISTAAIKILRFVLQNNLKNSAALKMTKSQLKEAARAIDSLTAAHQDSELKSIKWITYLTEPLAV